MSFNLPCRLFSLSPPADLKPPALGLADFAIGLGVLTLLYIVSRFGAQSLVKFSPPDIIPIVSLDPRNLPNCAARLFIAGCSTLFTFVYRLCGSAQ
jgi:NitT/TauT family transport system permease protein